MIGVLGKPSITTDRILQAEVAEFIEHAKTIPEGLARCSWTIGSFGVGETLPAQMHYRMWLDGVHEDQRDLDRVLNSLGTMSQKYQYIALKYKVATVHKIVPLRSSPRYDFNDRPDLCVDTPAMSNFTSLVPWLHRLPFKGVGRVLFFIQSEAVELPQHRDGYRKVEYSEGSPAAAEFLIFRGSYQPVYVLDEKSNTKHYLKGVSSWFNSNDIHGSDVTNRLTWSLRVDGLFTDSFKEALSTC